MRPPIAQLNHQCPAPCRGAQRLLAIAISASVLLGLAATADLTLRSARQNDSANSWMKAMTLSAPALWPAGSPMRHPETLHPGVDLRFSAGLVAAP